MTGKQTQQEQWDYYSQQNYIVGVKGAAVTSLTEPAVCKAVLTSPSPTEPLRSHGIGHPQGGMTILMYDNKPDWNTYELFSGESSPFYESKRCFKSQEEANQSTSEAGHWVRVTIISSSSTWRAVGGFKKLKRAPGHSCGYSYG